jgi:uncharacterized protein
LRRAVALLAVAAVAGLVMPEAGAERAPRSPAAPLTVQGSVRQVAVTGAAPGIGLALVDATGRTRARGTTDGTGALLLRDVVPGPGYRIEGPDGLRSSPVRVADDRPPPHSFFTAQHLVDGYGYVTTRDGTKLAVNVRLPGPIDGGPYPTVVEYSGYDPANPDGNQAAMRLAQTLGYATVGVNMRGTGCSGGAWEYFEPLQALDGYDAVEAIAAQPWVAHGKVGMVGISYSGITQLFVAATRPPHLAAITPLSVIADTYRGVLYPGGILNTGFAVPWAQDRQSDARPSPAGGQGWARRRIAAGDATCAADQALRGQTPDVLREIRADAYYSPARLDHVTPTTFADRIDVPTFLAGSWQDEQTGGYWPALVDHFDPSVALKVTITNGTHAEPFGPDIITRWAEFLDFYVARRVPRIPAVARANAAGGYVALTGVPLQLPPDRFGGETDFDAALARYQAEPRVRILFDNGAGGPAPGAPVAAFEAEFPAWPPPAAKTRSLYLGAHGALQSRAPQTNGADSYRYDPKSIPATDHPSHDDDFFRAQPAYDWRPLPRDLGVGYLSAPIPRDTVVLGPVSADLWLRSSARDTDLEVVLSEVRPDGQETYVQSGWLRASRRALDPSASSTLLPVPTYRRHDAAPLPRGRFTEVHVPVFPVGHVFRAGSRLRVVVQPPGGNRPQWAFDALPGGPGVRDVIAHGTDHPSRILLPVVQKVAVTSPLPPCGALRGQPCRQYVPSRAGG